MTHSRSAGTDRSANPVDFQIDVSLHHDGMSRAEFARSLGVAMPSHRCIARSQVPTMNVIPETQRNLQSHRPKPSNFHVAEFPNRFFTSPRWERSARCRGPGEGSEQVPSAKAPTPSSGLRPPSPAGEGQCTTLHSMKLSNFHVAGFWGSERALFLFDYADSLLFLISAISAISAVNHVDLTKEASATHAERRPSWKAIAIILTAA